MALRTRSRWVAGIVFAVGFLFILSGCTKYATPEQMKQLDQAKAAALSAEKQLEDKKAEHAALEKKLADKNIELQRAQDEKAAVQKRVDAIKAMPAPTPQPAKKK